MVQNMDKHGGVAVGNGPYQMGKQKCGIDPHSHGVQEVTIPLAEFVPPTITVEKDRKMYASALSQLFRNYSKMLAKCKVFVNGGSVTVKGVFGGRKDMKHRLDKLCLMKIVRLSERHCYALMSHQNLVDFTKETGAFAICRPKQEMMFVIGPQDAIDKATAYVDRDADGAKRTDRRVMTINVLARNHILDNRHKLVEKGHIWVDRMSEREGQQELHIVGYSKDFDFDAAERTIRKLEKDYIQAEHPPTPPGLVAILQSNNGTTTTPPTQQQQQIQVRKHRDSSKLLIAERTDSGGMGPVGSKPSVGAVGQTSPTGEERSASRKACPLPIGPASQNSKTCSTVDFPYLTNPLQNPALFRPFRDPNNIWAAGLHEVSSTSGSTCGSTLFAYHSSASSSGIPEIDPDLCQPFPSGASLLYSQVVLGNHRRAAAERGSAGNPSTSPGAVSSDERPPLSRSGPRLSSPSPSNGRPPRFTPSAVLRRPADPHSIIKVLVSYTGVSSDDPLQGNHSFKLSPDTVFAQHKEEICQRLGIPPFHFNDYIFNHQDEDFDEQVRINDDEKLQNFSRVYMTRVR
eukprot:TRINITY_DN1263_c0_g1_i1.p1 TRINITY_DN1263_c0_g1~~TRINITY_DN1263_c0_g1_i1.p1  ORF type:complete len:572 (+),score=175.46 TRINITY_DN1263_c0_g1_i1:169-1884(+)